MIIGIDKPSGVSTHASNKDPAHEGAVEYYSRVYGKKLFVCHRLDKETSGALLFATSPEDAAVIGAQFEARTIRKTYLFVTDKVRGRKPDTFAVSSLIEKQGASFTSTPSDAANAHTDFEFVREESGYSLWRVRPRTGKPHQIRLHAEASGLAILGDDEHGGSTFPGLMLLSESIVYESDSSEKTHSVPRSRLFENLHLCRNQMVASWILGIEKRERWARSWAAVNPAFALGETYRMVHTDNGGPLRVDKLGDTIAMQWFTDEPELHIRDREDIEELIAVMRWTKWHLQIRTDRGHGRAFKNTQAPDQSVDLTSVPAPPVRWIACEHDLKFEFRLDSSLSTGLFLDQRANRYWIEKNSREKSVLNLFSYTGGFSIAAARGGATKTVSVDLSKNFIEWSKRNFEINELDVAQHEFWAFDSRDFLKLAAKKQRKFDIVICDPPSFSRSDKGVFRIEKDLPALLTSLADVIADHGTILFATNFEGWSLTDFMSLMKVEAQRLRMTLANPPPGDWDFDFKTQVPLMKSVFLTHLSE